MRILMKKIAFVSIVFVMLISCKSTDKLIQNKQYDEEIEQLVEKLTTKKPNEKTIQSLTNFYHSANQMDHERIQSLKASGQPEAIVVIYEKYSAMEYRQNLIKRLPENLQNQINFVPLDLQSQLSESKVKAQRYLYAKSAGLQKTGSKPDAKVAYNLLIKLKRINPTYPEIDVLLRQALFNSATNVLLKFENNTGITLSQNTVNRIMYFSLEELPSPTVTISSTKEENIAYDYTFLVRLDAINVSPERTESRTFTEKKDIQGKILQEVIVNEYNMSKSCEMKAIIAVFEPTTKNAILSTPVNATSNFSYSYATAKGDHSALSERTKELVRNNKITFPATELLVLDASKQLNILVKQVIYGNANAKITEE
jgi:hypothetical protein